MRTRRSTSRLRRLAAALVLLALTCLPALSRADGPGESQTPFGLYLAAEDQMVPLPLAAGTWTDQTTYFATVPSAHWKLLMEIEADRISRVVIDPTSLEAEKAFQNPGLYLEKYIVQPRHVMELLARYNELVYPGVHPGNPLWRPNAHEYYSQWEPFAREPRPKPPASPPVARSPRSSGW